MFAVRNNLDLDVRTGMIDRLNGVLADAVDLSLMAKQAHWNVKGPHFRPLHELFDELHEMANGWSDLLAERAVALGGIALGTREAIEKASTLGSYPTGISAGPDHVDAIATALGVFGTRVRSSIDTAEAAGDAGTADLFTEVVRDADKMLWFVEAHLHADR